MKKKKKKVVKNFILYDFNGGNGNIQEMNANDAQLSPARSLPSKSSFSKCFYFHYHRAGAARVYVSEALSSIALDTHDNSATFDFDSHRGPQECCGMC